MFTSREGGQCFYTRGGGQTVYVGGLRGYANVDEEIDLSEVNIILSKASKFSAGT